MKIPLEDTYLDVIGKAQRGLGFTEEGLASKLGLSVKTLAAVKAGEPPAEQTLIALAEVLQLKASALISLAQKAWEPGPIVVEGLIGFNTPFRDMTVNNYLVGDLSTGRAMVFDTGTDLQPLLQELEKAKWKLEAIFLTHTHGDHVLELDLLKEKTGAPAYVSERETIDGAESFSVGRVFSVGNLKVGTRLTSGHSKGGTTYVIEGLARPVAVVGDALFSCSMGGGGVSYEEALRTNRQAIYSLAEETVLCPGHGPVTTVKDEKTYNPFFLD